METSDEVYQDDNITTNVSQLSNKSTSSIQEIAEKLMAKANQSGIRSKARRRKMSFSTLRVWWMQDFGDLPGAKKRLPSLKYV